MSTFSNTQEEDAADASVRYSEVTDQDEDKRLPTAGCHRGLSPAGPTSRVFSCGRMGLKCAFCRWQAAMTAQ